jgi:hypothetical protein
MTYKVRRMRDGLKYEVSEEVYRSRMSETPLKTRTKDGLIGVALFCVFILVLSFILGD